jgi:hypothetical protein
MTKKTMMSTTSSSTSTASSSPSRSGSGVTAGRRGGSGAARTPATSAAPAPLGREHTPALVRRRVAEQLLARRDSTGRGLCEQDYAVFAATTGRSARQIRRWVAAEEARRARATLAGDTTLDRAAKAAARRALTGQRPRFELTDDMLTVLAASPSVYEAWLFLRYGDPGCVVARDQVSKSTFYEAVNRLPAAVRVGLVRGGEETRDLSPHLPREITRFGQSYSYDLKNLRVTCVHDDGEIHSDDWLLSFRDEASSLVVGRWVIPYAPTDVEVAAALAEAVRGWTLDGVTVTGAPMLLRTDNGSNLNGPQMRRAQALLGSLITPSESYESAGNGRHERMHLDLDRDLSTLPGYNRSPLKRGGKPYLAPVGGDLLTFDQLTGRVYDLIDELNFTHRPATDRHAGRTPFEMAAELIAAGEHELTDVPDELLAPLGLPLPTRTYNLNEGTLTWDSVAFHHPDLSDRGDTHYRATRLPNDPTIVFVLDTDGRYVTTAVRLRDLPTGLRNRTMRDRKDREHLVDRHQAAAARKLAAATWTTAFVPTPSSDQDADPTDADPVEQPTVQAPTGSTPTPSAPANASAAQVDELLAARGITS